MAPASLSSTASETSNSTADRLTSIADDAFSDESDFHGSLETRSTYNKRAAAYNPRKYWTIHERNTQVAAARGRKARHKAARQHAQLALEKQQAADLVSGDHPGAQSDTEEQGHVNKDGDGDMEMKVDTTVNALTAPEPGAVDKDSDHGSRTPQNFYEGIPSAKQLSESVSDFLTRMPPSTTTSVSAGGRRWIWIANPYPAASQRSSPGQARDPSSNPESGDGDIATFRQLGTRLLEMYLSRKHEAESQNPGKASGSITRILRPERVKLESDIKELARAQRVTAGKWMLFPREGEVDRVWAVVARAVWGGTLGTAAKVATAKGEGEAMVDAGVVGGDGDGDDGGDGGGKNRDQRLICIYTHDFSDQADVKRVLRALKDVGLLNLGGGSAGFKTIYYKCDAYTYLDLTSGNEYRLRASMYSSRDLFPEWYEGPSTGSGYKYR